MADAGLNFTDPQITYDDQQNQFFIGAVAYGGTVSHFDYALLDGSSPTLMPITGTVGYADTSEGGQYVSDFPRVGWNADAYFVTTNEFLNGQSYSHVLEMTIAKSSMMVVNHFDSGGGDFTVVPATIHNAAPGDNEYFVEEHGYDNGHQLQVVVMANVLGSFKIGSLYLTVPSYGAPPSAAQPGGSGIDTNDTRILTVAGLQEGANLELVATQNVGASSVAQVRIYDMIVQNSIGPTGVTLNQTLQINAGRGVSTYYPAADIDPSGDIGITYMQSSRKQYMSMYVTGRLATDPLGKVQTPQLAKAGEGTYYGSRAGDFSGLEYDPSTGTFWAASEYAKTPANAYWGTWIAGFSVSSGRKFLAASPTSGSGSLTGGPSGRTGLPILSMDDPIAILLAAADESGSWDWFKKK